MFQKPRHLCAFVHGHRGEEIHHGLMHRFIDGIVCRPQFPERLADGIGIIWVSRHGISQTRTGFCTRCTFLAGCLERLPKHTPHDVPAPVIARGPGWPFRWRSMRLPRWASLQKETGQQAKQDHVRHKRHDQPARPPAGSFRRIAHSAASFISS
jgi:hypothetical protein